MADNILDNPWPDNPQLGAQQKWTWNPGAILRNVGDVNGPISGPDTKPRHAQRRAT